MTDREELIYRAARALDTSRMAEEDQYAADESHGTPEAAASAHWDAASLLRQVGERFLTLADSHTFEAKRMDREHRKEKATGVEYRLGNDAA